MGKWRVSLGYRELRAGDFPQVLGQFGGDGQLVGRQSAVDDNAVAGAAVFRQNEVSPRSVHEAPRNKSSQSLFVMMILRRGVKTASVTCYRDYGTAKRAGRAAVQPLRASAL